MKRAWLFLFVFLLSNIFNIYLVSAADPDIYENSFETIHGPRNDRFGWFGTSDRTTYPPPEVNLIENASGAFEGSWYIESNELSGTVTNAMMPQMYLHLADNNGQPLGDFEAASDLYVRLWLKIEIDISNGSKVVKGGKLFRFWRPDGSAAGQSIGYLAIPEGDVLPGSLPHFDWNWDQFYTDNPSRVIRSNGNYGFAEGYVASGPRYMPLNEWTLIEIRLNMNPGGRARLQFWVNDEQLFDFPSPLNNTGDY